MIEAVTKTLLNEHLKLSTLFDQLIPVVQSTCIRSSDSLRRRPTERPLSSHNRLVIPVFGDDDPGSIVCMRACLRTCVCVCARALSDTLAVGNEPSDGE